MQWENKSLKTEEEDTHSTNYHYLWSKLIKALWAGNIGCQQWKPNSTHMCVHTHRTELEMSIFSPPQVTALLIPNKPCT